jgi:MscS family membrane protein
MSNLLPNLHTENVLVAIVIVTLAWAFQRYVLKPLFGLLSQFLNRRNAHFYMHITTHYGAALRYTLIVSSIVAAGFLLYGIPLKGLFLDPHFSNLFKSVCIFFGFLGIYRLLDFYANHPIELELVRKVNAESVLLPIVFRIAKYGVMCVALMFIAHDWGYDMNGIATGLGIGGIALALGIKDILSNLFGGIAVALDKPFARGDRISTLDRTIEGIVEDVNFRSTKIRTFDKAALYVPNIVLATQPIINWNRRDVRRVPLQLAISPSTPESQIRRAMERIEAEILTHDGIQKEEGVNVFIDEFTEAGLMLKIVYFTDTEDYKASMHTKQEVNFVLARIMQEEKVTLSPVSQHMTWNRVV